MLNKVLSLIYLSDFGMIIEIALNDISIKARSKKEVYLVLTVEGGLYLPPVLDSNRIYIIEIMNG